MNNIIVLDEDKGTRLDKYLLTQRPELSRSFLQTLIANGSVRVNDTARKANYSVKAGDTIVVDIPAPAPTTLQAQEIPLDILFEDDSLLVVNKPAGMVVHPAAGNLSGTLANGLAFHFGQLSTRSGAVRPGIVHRLDKGTSGLLVVAKNEPAHEALADQFRRREVFKSYVALVHGQIARDHGQIDEPIARDPRNRTRMAVVRGGRPALSLYHARERFQRFTRLDVELKTGRTHQIRVHLAWMKHPVVGDEVYGGGRDKTVSDPAIRGAIAKLGRQFLHARELGFRHPATQQELRFTAPLPLELHQLLELLTEKKG